MNKVVTNAVHTALAAATNTSTPASTPVPPTPPYNFKLTAFNDNKAKWVDFN